MTGTFNDAAFRNQVWAAQQDAITDQFRQAAAGRVAGMVQRTGEFLGRAAQANRQFDAQMAQDRQQFEQSHALDTVMTDAKLQLMEQEMQQNAVKLRALEAIDHSQRSREQTRAMQLENKERELRIKQLEERMQQSEEDRPTKLFTDVMRSFGGVDGAAATGYVVSGGNGEPFRLEYDPDRAKQTLESLRGVDLRLTEEQRRQADSARRRLQLLHDQYYSFDGQIAYRQLPPDKRARLDALRETLERQVYGLVGPQAPNVDPAMTPLNRNPDAPLRDDTQPGDPQGGLQQAQPQDGIDPDRAEALGQAAVMTEQAFARDPDWAGFFDGMGDDDRTYTLSVLAAYAQDLVANNKTTVEMAPTYVMDVLRGHGVPTARLLYTLGYDPETQILPIIQSRTDDPKTLEKVQQVLREMQARAEARLRDLEKGLGQDGGK